MTVVASLLVSLLALALIATLAVTYHEQVGDLTSWGLFAIMLLVVGGFAGLLTLARLP